MVIVVKEIKKLAHESGKQISKGYILSLDRFVYNLIKEKFTSCKTKRIIGSPDII